ncbi:glycosyltransferase family 2 protein [Microbacterium sp. QXD-8]|uniref:Glycosyltransferase family 2 protein n=1 Tax=Microbacterium psychrotolerans TaxID=3068321 RepID=A0ABU0Z1A8_9MICO|nr:glycosyltransferase family 2 protein [Microbacterium sp. QXD-8]MDQ7878363.1 glycosyltransferase family 2 protein [Microbacterium sp. QXD-8]
MPGQVTVIMPVADSGKTIEAAVRTTLLSLDREGVVLVYDDASSDDTVDKLKRIMSRDRRVRLIRGQTRVGVAVALNALLSETTTDLVARMDGDDLVLPGRFRRQVHELTTSRVDVTFTSRINFGSNLRHYRPYLQRRISPDRMPWLMLSSNPVPHSSMLGRTRVLTGAGGYRQSVAEDYDLWLRLLSSGHRLSSSAIPGIAYRMHPNQVTRSAEWLVRFEKDEVLRASYNQLAITLGLDGDAWELRRARPDVAANRIKAGLRSGRQPVVHDSAGGTAL